jgi:anaerobic selenocysteine-containing dehydrogenase
VRFLLSAHASHEEMFVAARLGLGLLGDAARDAFSVAWTRSVKPQPPDTRFRVPEVDAPNVAGAKALGLVDAAAVAPDLAALQEDVAAGRVSALYVLHPGPADALGDVSWILDARASGRLQALVVQAVLESPLTQAADVVLPGATWLEKDGAYANADGRLQRASQAILPIGEAREDWRVVVDVAAALGIALPFDSVQSVREAIAALLSEHPSVTHIETLGADRPRSARNWLQASNPSERWKWDFLFQDLPPVKFHDLHAAGTSAQSTRIPLKPVDPAGHVE